MDRVCVAGGAVLHNMIECGYGDIDFFPIGTPEENMRTIMRLLGYWNYKFSNGRYTRSDRVIEFEGTVKSSDTNHFRVLRQLQIILMNNASVDEVISTFDIDCVKVAYYNGLYYYNEYSKYAIRTASNVITDISVSDESFAHRLIKYGKRGFRTLIPGYIPLIEDQITAMQCYNRYKTVSGLTELLVANYKPNYERSQRDVRGNAAYNGKIGILRTVDDKKVTMRTTGLTPLVSYENGKQVALIGYRTDSLEAVYKPPAELDEVADNCKVTRLTPFKLTDDLKSTRRPFTWPEFIYRMTI